MKLNRTRLLFVTVIVLTGAFLAGWLWWRSSPRYRDRFAEGMANEWTPFGGAWQTTAGTMKNRSDDRGVKLVTGSRAWRDYVVESDVQLLSRWGDAGVLLRSNDEERGVDAYSGYYVGMRMLDQALVAGRGDHEWMEGRPAAMPGGVEGFRWYHLKVVAYGCQIAAQATQVGTSNQAQVVLEDADCVHSGRIGLRAVSTGAEWRNVQVRPAARSDLNGILEAAGGVVTPQYPQSEAAYNATHSFPTFDPPSIQQQLQKDESPLQSITALRTGNGHALRAVRFRGVVALTSPRLYVQDVTGGVEVEPAAAEPIGDLVNLGDEVEVAGELATEGFVPRVRRAVVRRLWDRTPVLPVAISSSQAATGTFEATLVEVQGVLRSASMMRDGSLQLVMDDGAQTFRAEGDPQSVGSFLRLTPHSLLKLRGVCTIDGRFTHDDVPFAILLRSPADVDVLAGPPWWSARRLLQIAAGGLLLVLAGLYVYTQVENWRWRSIVWERERLAHDLHDTLAQSFAGVSFQLQGIRRGIRSNSPASMARATEQLDLACEIVRQTHEEASLTIAMLRQEAPQPGDLGESLHQAASRMVALGSVRLAVHSAGQLRVLPLRVVDALFHIGREAIVNAVRHAHTCDIKVLIEYGRREVVMTIEDFGRGFDTEAHPRGFGIRGMGKRARDIGAVLQIVSDPERGTKVVVRAPAAAPISLAQRVHACFSGEKLATAIPPGLPSGGKV